MQPNQRENNLVAIATFLLVSGGTDVDFSKAFFPVLFEFFGYFLLNVILTFIVYSLFTKPFYKWLINK